MRTFILLTTVLIFCLAYTFAPAQSNTDDQGFETFEMPDGDTTWTMKKYYFCMLAGGPSQAQSPEEVTGIQKGHMAHLKMLGDTKKICMAGPFNGHDEYRGIVIFNTTTREEAVELMNMDPAVKAGRLKFEIVEWWAAKGAKLF